MSDTKYNNTLQLCVNGEVVKPSAFIEAVLTKVPSLNEDKVKLALRRAQLGDLEWPEDMSGPDMKAIIEVEKLAKAAYAKADEILKKRMADETELCATKELERIRCVEAYQGAELSEALVKPIANMVDEYVAIALGEKFTMKDGLISLKKDVEPYAAFSSGFSNLVDLSTKSSELYQGFANYEAKLGLAAKKELGDNWPVVLAGADKKDQRRISKNMSAVSRFEAAGFKSNNVPIGTIRVLTEVSYDKDEGKNSQVLKDTITKFFEESKKKGSMLNQIDARTLVNSATPQKRAEAKQNWDTLYIIGTIDNPKVIGSMDIVDEQFNKALRVIDRKGCNTVTREDDGSYVYSPIPTYVGEASEKALENQTKMDPKIIPFTPPDDDEPVIKDTTTGDIDSLFDDLEI